MGFANAPRNVTRAFMIALITGVVGLEQSRPLRAAGEIVPLTIDTEWVDDFYRQGIVAYRNRDFVSAVRLLSTYLALSSRVATLPNPNEAQLQADVFAAINLLNEGLAARNALPYVQDRLMTCEARPQCGGGGGLRPGLDPPVPQTRLPPVPPRLR